MRRLRHVLTGSIVLTACAGAPTPPAVPFDVRPTMTGLRVDTLAIARALETSKCAAVVAHARRLEATAIVPAGATASPEFDALAAGFATSARMLRRSLETDDVPRARIAFSQLLQRCDACHTRFRATDP